MLTYKSCKGNIVLLLWLDGARAKFNQNIPNFAHNNCLVIPGNGTYNTSELMKCKKDMDLHYFSGKLNFPALFSNMFPTDNSVEIFAVFVKSCRSVSYISFFLLSAKLFRQFTLKIIHSIHSSNSKLSGFLDEKYIPLFSDKIKSFIQ